MRIKLTKAVKFKDHDELEEGSVVEVSDEVAKTLIDSEQAEEYSEKAEKKAVELEVKEILDIDEDEGLETNGSKVEIGKDESMDFKSTEDFLSAVITAGTTGRVDKKLTAKSTGQNETTVGDGGYLVEHRIGNEIYSAAKQASVLLPKCSVLEIGPNSNGMKINQVNESTRSATTLFGGVRCYSPAEGIAATAFKQAYSQVDISLGRLSAVNYLTDELMADRVALASSIRSDVGAAMAWVIDDDIISGTTNTDMIEIVNHAATVQFTVAGNTPTAAELAGMYASMIPSSINRAEWYMTIGQYVGVMQLEDTSGRKLVQQSYETSAYGYIFGRRINVIEQGGALTDDNSIMFLDLSQYLVIKRGGVEEATSIHVKFLESEMAFKWSLRMGGSPKLASTVTLPSGDIVSSFVTRD